MKFSIFKNRLLLLICFSFCLFFLFSCYTVRTPFATDTFSPPAGDYVILGRVTAKTRFMQSGYALLREQAAARYPDADDVIHVQVDGKRNILLYILLRTYTYELSGLAIKYVDSVKASDNSMLKDDRDSFESHSSE